MLVRSTLSIAPYRQRFANLLRYRPGILLALLPTCGCLLLSACSDDHQAPKAISTDSQPDQAASQALTIPTPAPQVGAASDSLATPVIHTVD